MTSQTSARHEALRSRGRRPAGVVIAVLAAVALGGAACGGVSGPGVASIGSTTTTLAAAPTEAAGSSGNVAATELRYARCMQSHGVPGYPEPGPNAVATAHALEKLDPTAPRFASAQRSCQSALPSGAPVSAAERERVLNEALKFAHCMQTHGMAKWPDPTARGYMVAPVGAAAHSPTYLAADKACKALLPSG